MLRAKLGPAWERQPLGAAAGENPKKIRDFSADRAGSRVNRPVYISSCRRESTDPQADVRRIAMDSRWMLYPPLSTLDNALGRDCQIVLIICSVSQLLKSNRIVPHSSTSHARLEHDGTSG